MTEHESTARRRPWLAGLLSAGTAGLGQLYNGELFKAILAVVLLSVASFACIALMLEAPLHPPYNLILPLLLLMAVYVAVIRDAVRVARRQGDTYVLKPFNRWYWYLGFIVIAGLVSSAGQDVIQGHVQSFRVPSGSMVPTILIGDHITIDKMAYGPGRTPQRSDIIVLISQDGAKKFVKRVIGLPGDTIEIRNKEVFVNGAALDDSGYSQRVDRILRRHDVRDNFGPVAIPEHAYFVLGDNRDQSVDSRTEGPVPLSEIEGKVRFVYWSLDPDASRSFLDRIRWARIGWELS